MMSDQVDPTPQAESSSQPAQQKSSSSSLQKGIRIALFVILALLIIAIIYDRQVARPAVESAYQTIEELNAASGSKVLTDADVHEALGRQPSYTRSDGPYTLEVFAYRAGLPWRTYPYTVVYSGESNRYFMTHFKFEEVTMDTLAPPAQYKPGEDAVPDTSPPPSGAPAPAQETPTDTEADGAGRPALEDESETPPADAAPAGNDEGTADAEADRGEEERPEPASAGSAAEDAGKQVDAADPADDTP